MPTLIVAAIGLTGVAATVATALIGFAISYAIQSLFAPDEPETPPDQGVSARIPTDPKNKLPVVYGEQRVAGQTVFADISSNNQTMYFIIALCEGPVEDITAVTWENKVLTFKDGGNIKTGLRAVDKAKSSNPNDETSEDFLTDKFRCQVFINGGDCTPLTAGKSSRWNTNRSNRTFPNTAYAYVELDYNREDRITGLPGKLYFTVKGRTVRTLSGTTLSTSTTMSTNPVDNLIDYMTDTRYGCGLKDSDLDLVSFNKHKTFCNGQLPFQQNSCVFPSNSVTTSGGSTAIDPADYTTKVDCEDARFFVGTTASTATWTLGTATMDNRYTTNGVLNTNNELDRNLSDLTVGNGGVLTYNLGKFGIVSQGTQSVVQRDSVDVSFSEDNIIGKLDITGSGFDAVLNEVTAKFTSKRQLYQQEQAVISYENFTGANEGGSTVTVNSIQNPNEPRLEKTIQFPFTNNAVEARRLGRVIINDSRQALIVSFQSNIDNTDLQAGDIIKISHDTPGWTNKEFRVQQVDERIIDKDNSSIGVSIIAREYAAEVYNSETLLLEDPAPNTNLPNPLVTSTLTLVTSDASALNDKGIPVNRIRVDWSTSADLTYVDTVDVRIFKGTTDGTNVDNLLDTDWEYYATTSESIVISDYGSESISESTVYQIQARPRNTLGALGVYAPNQANRTASTPVTTASLDSIFEVDVNLEATGGTVFKNGSASTDKTVTATVTKVTETDAVLADHNTFNYLWKQDGKVICIDSPNKNVVGVAELDLSFTGLRTFTKEQCESAGGTFTAGGEPLGTVNSCTVGGSDIGSIVLGCAVATTADPAFRADTDATGFNTSSDKIRTIIVDYTDITVSSGFSCEVSNIELT